MLKNAIAKVKGFVSNNKSLVRASAVTSVVSSAALCASIFVSAADDSQTAISNALTSGVNTISSNVLSYIAMLLPSCLGVFGMMIAIGTGIKFIKKIIK